MSRNSRESQESTSFSGGVPKGKQHGSACQNRTFTSRGFRGKDRARYSRKAPWLKKMSFKELEKLREQDSGRIALTLSCEECCFEDILREFRTDFDEVALLTSLLAKICQSHISVQNTLKILVYVQSSSFLTVNTATQLAKLPSDQTIGDKKLASFLEDTILLLQELAKRMPHVFNMTVGVVVLLEGTVEQLKGKLGAGLETIDLELRKLNMMKTNALEQVAKETKKVTGTIGSSGPPDDFRYVSVLPQNADLVPDAKPFLRKNIKVGAYENVDHYLDTQFRLLREDFIQPLREGIEEYINSKKNPERKCSMRSYNNVCYVRVVCSEEGILYRIKLDLGSFPDVDWGNTKRLNYGSLVCLSNDGFDSFCFATVVRKDDIQQGLVDIAFDDKFDVSVFPADKYMAMVETPAYFEAYRHVLKGLQNMKDDMPFTRYIVDCESDLRPPGYLLKDEDIKYDLTSLLTNTAADPIYENDIQNISILDKGRWPRAEDIAMNASQFEAFQAALTKEFVMIQGPPGTGKTYIGLKIAKALLKNQSKWTDDSQKSPLLVVCYTNHALDQFLEGILTFFDGSLIRVGSRSKSERLEKCNLKTQKNVLCFGQENLDDKVKEIVGLKDKHRKNYLDMREEIEGIGRLIDAIAYGVCHERYLRPFMKKHYHGLLKGLPCRRIRSPILEWLGFLGTGRVLEITKSFDLSNEKDLSSFVREIKGKRVSERKSLLVLDQADFDLNNEDWLSQHKMKISLKRKMNYKSVIGHELMSDQVMTNGEADRIWNVWKLGMAQRWKLYRLWINNFVICMRSMMDPLRARCNESAAMYKEASAQIDKHILSEATVIGMTTTGAARHQSVLAEIQPPVVIIEEAAEVLEGHVVTSLSSGTKHLILIGDHQQLRPTTNVYELAKRYNLDLSLFERMINNGVPFNCLQLQHRMRPSISRLLGNIYPDLKDHDSVFTYDSVLGMTDNVYFMTHTELECHNEETMSHMNEFEANYLTALCRYLLKQGYSPSSLTILSFYSAQVTCFRKKLNEETEAGLVVTAVDNYQGEENDIILLSLVRSNLEGKIGFLGNENRICVALSRAKIGLYVVGNFQLLSEKSKMWRNIVTNLESENRIGPALKIFCRNHPGEHSILAEQPNDFLKAPEGGCTKPCQFRLACGHVCELACHPYDPQHIRYQCRKPCTTIICDQEHICPLECWKECGECKFPVEKQIPTCGHVQDVPCCLDPKQFKCEGVCTKQLSCGHPCGEKCGYNHKCHERVSKSWECGHTAEVPCVTKAIEICQEKCHTILECKHTCSGSCQQCSQGRLHLPCRKECRKILPCGHACRSNCSTCPPCTHPCENVCNHSTCSKKCGEPCTPCTEKCIWSCPHYKCNKLCSEECDRPRCNEPCSENLSCGHSCIGLCGEPCPPYCRLCHEEELKEVMSGTEDSLEARFIYLDYCGHIVEVNAMDKLMDEKEVTTTIQLKQCPMCNTPIRWNMRYGKIIKKALESIEEFKKKKQAIEKKRSEILKTEIMKAISQIREAEQKGKVFKSCLKFLETERDLQNKSKDDLRAIFSQIRLLQNAEVLKNKLKTQTLALELNLYGLEGNALKSDLETYTSWLMHPRQSFSLQESHDADMEQSRLGFGVFLLTHTQLLEKHSIKLADDLKHKLEKSRCVVTDRCRLTAEKKEVVEDLRKTVDDLVSKCHSEERREITVKTMGSRGGHLFKCKNGHIYAVSDSGTLTMEAQCPECDHVLRQDNCAAGEMNGNAVPKKETGGDVSEEALTAEKETIVAIDLPCASAKKEF